MILLVAVISVIGCLFKGLSRPTAGGAPAAASPMYYNKQTSSTPPTPSKPIELEWRIWTSGNGKYTTDAKFIKFKDSKVHLEKRDGKVVTMSMNALSAADQKFIRDKLKGL